MLSGDRTFSFLRRGRPAVGPTPGERPATEPPRVPLRSIEAESRHLRRARQIVAADPVRNVHVGAMLPSATGESTRGVGQWALLDGPRTIGLVQQFRGVCWAVESSRRADPRLPGALAEIVGRNVRFSEVLFGPEDEVRAVIDHCRSRGLDLVELRRQEMMACAAPSRDLLPEPGSDFNIRLAVRRDLTWLMEAHAAMCREDLGVDQVARNPDGYARYFEDLLRRRRIFLGETGGQPVFKAEVALESREAWLIEGVYTQPSERGRGRATRAMAALADLAHARGRIACLYVHRRNEGAIRVYRHVGFRTVAPWATAIVTRDGRRSIRATEY